MYVLAQLTITDRTRYNRYQAAFLDVLHRYGGTLLAADEHPEVIEGSWPHHKVVLLAFDDRQQFARWSRSPEYTRIALDRKAGSDAVVLLTEGAQ